MITMNIENYILGLFLVACQTENCLNFHIPVELWIEVNDKEEVIGVAICGPCGVVFPPENIVEKPE